MAGVKGRSGRKPKWTDEQIEEAAQDLLDWLAEAPRTYPRGGLGFGPQHV